MERTHIPHGQLFQLLHSQYWWIVYGQEWLSLSMYETELVSLSSSEYCTIRHQDSGRSIGQGQIHELRIVVYKQSYRVDHDCISNFNSTTSYKTQIWVFHHRSSDAAHVTRQHCQQAHWTTMDTFSSEVLFEKKIHWLWIKLEKWLLTTELTCAYQIIHEETLSLWTRNKHFQYWFSKYWSLQTNRRWSTIWSYIVRRRMTEHSWLLSCTTSRFRNSYSGKRLPRTTWRFWRSKILFNAKRCFKYQRSDETF